MGECHAIDLHIHSIFSDGELIPNEILRRGKYHGLKYISTTDHDNACGTGQAMMGAQEIGIGYIPGIEFTCLYGNLEVHMLGLGFDSTNSIFRLESERAVKRYEERKDQIVKKIENDARHKWRVDHYALTHKPGIVTRINIANAVTNRNMSAESFFKKYLATGMKYSVEAEKFSIKYVVNLIHGAGGKVFWAHPGFTLRNAKSSFSVGSLAEKFSRYGIDGLECFYRRHTEEETGDVFDAAERHGLLKSAGSDLHKEKILPGEYPVYGFHFDPKEIINGIVESRGGKAII